LHPAVLADGKKEHALAFAQRAFLFVRNNFKYAYESGKKTVMGLTLSAEFIDIVMDRRASSIIKAGATDCGGFSILVCSDQSNLTMTLTSFLLSVQCDHETT